MIPSTVVAGPLEEVVKIRKPNYRFVTTPLRWAKLSRFSLPMSLPFSVFPYVASAGNLCVDFTFEIHGFPSSIICFPMLMGPLPVCSRQYPAVPLGTRLARSSDPNAPTTQS